MPCVRQTCAFELRAFVNWLNDHFQPKVPRLLRRTRRQPHRWLASRPCTSGLAPTLPCKPTPAPVRFSCARSSPPWAPQCGCSCAPCEPFCFPFFSFNCLEREGGRATSPQWRPRWFRSLRSPHVRRGAPTRSWWACGKVAALAEPRKLPSLGSTLSNQHLSLPIVSMSPLFCRHGGFGRR